HLRCSSRVCTCAPSPVHIAGEVAVRMKTHRPLIHKFINHHHLQTLLIAHHRLPRNVYARASARVGRTFALASMSPQDHHLSWRYTYDYHEDTRRRHLQSRLNAYRSHAYGGG